jgi:hypothetical protein
MKRTRFYRNRHGIEIDEDEALENGIILKDGVTISVPTAVRDSLSSLQRAVAADAECRVTDAFGGPAGRRPGYAIASDHAARDAKALAYANYDCDVQNGWRSTTSRDGALVADNEPRPRTESRFEATNAENAIRDHSRVMQEIYGAYDAVLTQRWRHK